MEKMRRDIETQAVQLAHMNSIAYRERYYHDEDGQVSAPPSNCIYLLIPRQFRLYRLCDIYLLPQLARWAVEGLDVVKECYAAEIKGRTVTVVMNRAFSADSPLSTDISALKKLK